MRFGTNVGVSTVPIVKLLPSSGCSAGEPPAFSCTVVDAGTGPVGAPAAIQFALIVAFVWRTPTGLHGSVPDPVLTLPPRNRSNGVGARKDVP